MTTEPWIFSSVSEICVLCNLRPSQCSSSPVKIVNKFKGREGGKGWCVEGAGSRSYCMVGVYRPWSRRCLGSNSLSSVSGCVTSKQKHLCFQRLISLFTLWGRVYLCDEDWKSPLPNYVLKYQQSICHVEIQQGQIPTCEAQSSTRLSI